MSPTLLKANASPVRSALEANYVLLFIQLKEETRRSMGKQMGEGAADGHTVEGTENHEEQTDLKTSFFLRASPWLFPKPHSITELGEVPRSATC